MHKLENFYQLRGSFGKGDHAGPKAGLDITSVLDRLGARSIFAARTQFGGRCGKLANRLLWLVNCWRCRQRLPSAATIFMSYPNETWSASAALCVLNEDVKRRKTLRLVTLINDLKSFHWAAGVASRSAENLAAARLECGEDRLCRLFDVIIVHNEAMRDLLIRCSVPSDKIRVLGIFDYLSDSPMPDIGEGDFRKIVYAGNLSDQKSPFVCKLREVSDCHFELYGPGYAESAPSGNVNYRGCFSPAELPSHLKGGFGLVWDGGSIDAVAGPIGEYYKIIAPHKLSLYLASGLPVVIWEKSGMADYVRAHGVGFCVSALREIGPIVKALTYAQYKELKLRAETAGEQLRKGANIRAIIADISEGSKS